MLSMGPCTRYLHGSCGYTGTTLCGALQNSGTDEVVGTVKMKSAKNPKGSGEAQHADAKQTSKQPGHAGLLLLWT